MGLLALVAAAGKRGIARERVLGILWPETDPGQARHTLSQTLYSLKRETGQDWILAAADLRLSPALSSDVGELQDALAAGDHLTVATLYHGEFLDGFYLPGAPEFERWLEEERARLRAAAMRATERLATSADASGQHLEAVRWWNRLAELDPLSARYVAGRMRALAAAGDRESALAHAKAHEELVRRELDADIDPSIRQLVSAMKAPATVAPPAVSGDSVRHGPPRSGTADQPGAAPQTGAGPMVGSAARRNSKLWWWIPVVGVLAASVALALPRLRSTGLPTSAFLAVGAIRAPGTPDSTALGSVLRDMLATSLGGVGGLQVVANSRLVELMPRGADTVPGATTDAARRAGATEVIEGELASEAGSLVLTLRRVSLDRGVVRRGYVVRAAGRYALVDSATSAIARDLRVTPPTRAVTDLRTSSPAAYALYDEGLRAYYGYDAPAAYRLMRAALEQDSNFVMAAYYAWQLSRGLADEATSARALERAKRLAPHTIERERLLIQASVAGLDAPLSESAAIAETLTVRYPTDPDGQIQLGYVRTFQGDWAGSVAAFERAVALDSVAGATSSPHCRVCLALGLMADAYLFGDSTAAAERSARRLMALRPDDPHVAGILVEPLLREGRRSEAEQAIEQSNRTSPVPPTASPMLHRDLIRWGRLEEADREFAADLLRPFTGIRGEARWLFVLSLRDQGRLREAAALLRENKIPKSTQVVAGLGPDSLSLAIVDLEMGRPDASARIFRAITARDNASALPLGYKSRVVTWMLTLAGTAHAAAGDTAVVRRLADSLEIIGRSSSYGRDLRLHHFLRGLLLQAEGRQAEAVDAFRRSMFSPTDGYTRTNLVMARSLIVLGRGPEAIAVLRPAIHGGVDGSNSYVSRTELHEALAQAFELAGRRDSAAVHYRAVEQAWRHADPEFQGRYRRAKLKAEGR